MKPLPAITAFFSCSFRDEDKPVNEYFLALLRALGISGHNVNRAYPETPPDKARGLIQSAQMFVAVATRRQRAAVGEWTMSAAVSEEISMAYALGKQILLFVEEGVTLGGMKHNFGSYQTFTRENLYSPALLEHVVSSLFSLRVAVITQHDLLSLRQVTEFYADFIRVLVELRQESPGQFSWFHSTRRKLVFTGCLERELKFGMRIDPLPEGVRATAPLIDWSFNVDGASQAFDVKTTLEEHTPISIQAGVQISPPPDKGDWIEYTTTYESPHLNPLFIHECDNVKLVRIDGHDFRCRMGHLPANPTRSLKMHIRFPRDYGLRHSDLHPFVGSYTQTINYLVPSEMERMKVTKDTFAGPFVELAIDSPLVGHVYGVAWNPPPAPKDNKSM